MRFLIDMPLAPGLARWLQAEGHDAIHASDAGLAFAPDVEILEAARQRNQVLVTADLDYPRILALTRSRRPGLILFRGGDFSESQTIALLTKVLNMVPADALLV
jgi:predicted nuclease of predicted toxin-antitoxin system